MGTSQDEFEELIQVTDATEADLLAAFLEDGDVTFKLIKTAQTMASLMPSSQAPIIFQVLKEDMARAQELLKAYRETQEEPSS
jgi:hypothetical protein